MKHPNSRQLKISSIIQLTNLRGEWRHCRVIKGEEQCMKQVKVRADRNQVGSQSMSTFIICLLI